MIQFKDASPYQGISHPDGMAYTVIFPIDRKILLWCRKEKKKKRRKRTTRRKKTLERKYFFHGDMYEIITDHRFQSMIKGDFELQISCV